MLLRHGETLWNIENRVQGHGDSPLTSNGQKQVNALGRRLQAVNFDMLISSDLGRARHTAEIIANYIKLPVQEDERLRERNFGIFEGLTLADIIQNYPEAYAKWRTDDPDVVISEGESRRQHFNRNISFLEEYIQQHPGKTLALVIHGGVLDSFYRYVSGLALNQPRCFVTFNASLNVISHGIFYATTRWVIETWGDIGHLADLNYHPGLG
jgi:probable phosphoglycerate mutase